MDSFSKKIIKKFRKVRDKRLKNWGVFFVNIGVSANMMTTLAMLLGLGAIYFLFTNLWLFLILASLHLIVDGLDGVIARASKPTIFGKYFDHISDRLVTLGVLFKIFWFFDNYYVLIALGIFLLAQIIHLATKLESPILCVRTIVLVIVALNLPTIAYLTVGISNAYALILQIKWYQNGS